MTDKHEDDEKSESEGEKKSPADAIYDVVSPLAQATKVIIQMAIGIIIVIYVGSSAMDFLLLRSLNRQADYFQSELGQLLGIIGYGLVISAAIDLAYMLFTKELDEAVDPLIVALSAGAILLLSEGERPDSQAVWAAPAAIILMVASIATLFWVKKNFLGEDEREDVERPKNRIVPRAARARSRSRGGPTAGMDADG